LAIAFLLMMGKTIDALEVRKINTEFQAPWYRKSLQKHTFQKDTKMRRMSSNSGVDEFDSPRGERESKKIEKIRCTTEGWCTM